MRRQRNNTQEVPLKFGTLGKVGITVHMWPVEQNGMKLLGLMSHHRKVFRSMKAIKKLINTVVVSTAPVSSNV